MISILQLNSITEAGVQELNTLVQQLHIGSNPSMVTRERVEEVLADTHAVLMTAQDNGKIVGMATLYILPKTAKRIAHIDDVVVSGEYRGHGLGEKLMRALIDIAREREVSSIELTSRPARVAAQKLYEKVGFKKRETDPFRLTF